MPVRVGTSGWQYADWRGGLYPAGVPQRLWLQRYAEVFDTVEVNNAFYRLPERSVFESWRDRTPPGFGLGSKLGPVLLQLPPTLQGDVELLQGCLACFPGCVRVAVEPRHRSWWTPEVRRVLSSYNAALCWADRRSRPITPLWRTADWGYLRLHEGRSSPWPRYGPTALRSWARRIAGEWGPAADVFVYVNNDQHDAAVLDAQACSRPVR